jgi:alkylation response protein AidB-like acyl-CoA dehydrogenase
MEFRLTPEQRDLVRRADELGRREFAPRAARWDRSGEYPHENVRLLREAGFLGMTVPERWGGPGRPLIDAVLVIEQVAKYCGVTARIVVETNMGALGVVMAYGTDAQRELVATRILQRGDKPAIAMTEPDAGTDLGALRTRAVRGDAGYVLDGVKCWITGGGVSESNLVLARLVDRDGTDQGIGALLVDRGSPGMRVARVEDAMGLRGIPEAELVFEGCRVPEDRVVVRDRERGFRMVMEGYNAQRVGASAVALGIAQGAHDLAVEHMHRRRSFGRPLADFQGLRWMMAESATRLEAMRLLIYRAAANARPVGRDGGGPDGGPDGDVLAMFPDAREASMAKAYAGRTAFEVTSEALQMFGAAGYSRDLPLERMLRDVRMFQIGGGTTQAQLNLIARGILGREGHAD